MKPCRQLLLRLLSEHTKSGEDEGLQEAKREDVPIPLGRHSPTHLTKGAIFEEASSGMISHASEIDDPTCNSSLSSLCSLEWNYNQPPHHPQIDLARASSTKAAPWHGAERTGLSPVGWAASRLRHHRRIGQDYRVAIDESLMPLESLSLEIPKSSCIYWCSLSNEYGNLTSWGV